MISPGNLYDFLKEKGVDFYTGVPDSLLKDFLQYLENQVPEQNHIITANEGLAVGLAAGYHLATGKLPLVYLQNSGLGNIINPVTSLADKEVYSIPMLLLIGWRGRPGIKDEPQHIKMGRITPALLDVLEIPYFILQNEAEFFSIIDQAITSSKEKKQPVAMLVAEDMFQKYSSDRVRLPAYSLQREQVIAQLLAQLHADNIVVCTTGKIGREFYEQNRLAGNKISKYFLSVGAMGHASHVALAISNQRQERVVMLDGDGAVLMHMGALPTIAHYAKGQFIHVVINNGAHESVGGQPTEASRIDLSEIAKASGYRQVHAISNETAWAEWLNSEWPDTPQFVEIRTNLSGRGDLGRPSGTGADWKKEWFKSLNGK